MCSNIVIIMLDEKSDSGQGIEEEFVDWDISQKMVEPIFHLILLYFIVEYKNRKHLIVMEPSFLR